MDFPHIPPEREAALKNRIRHLHQRKAFTYSTLLEEVAKANAKAMEQGGERLKKPISSTFSRWLGNSAELEGEWVLWLEKYLDANRLTTDYDQLRESIGGLSSHYIAHATAHYVRIKPDTQATAEKEASGWYAVWTPSGVQL